MNNEVLARLMKRLAVIERRAVHHRRGVITDIDPLSVALGASEIPYVGVKSVGDADSFEVGQIVSVLRFDRDLIVLGGMSGGGVVDPGGDEPVGAWQDLEPYLGTAWTTDGVFDVDAQHARFYKDRERVYFDGMIYHTGGGSVNRQVPVPAMPADYNTVSLLQTSTAFTDNNATTSSPDTRQQWWTVQALPITGGGVALSFEQNKGFLASPNFGYPPSFTYLYLNHVSYRLG